MSLKGKVAIVTGAGKGIGKGTALAMANAGIKVVLAGVREKSIGEVKQEVETITKEVIAVEADVSKWEDTERMAKSAVEHFGRIDILVNNAGIASTGIPSYHVSTLEIDDSEWEGVIGVNLKGQFHCAKSVMPFMMKQRFGRIINVSSATAFNASVGTAPYCSSKGGIISLTKALAKELGPYNICVNCVAPGFTLTPMQDSSPKEAIEMVKKMTPLGRIGMPADIAQAILFFASDSLFITGQTLVVDGGQTMQ